jgi:hypothetical protein
VPRARVMSLSGIVRFLGELPAGAPEREPS